MLLGILSGCDPAANPEGETALESGSAAVHDPSTGQDAASAAQADPELVGILPVRPKEDLASAAIPMRVEELSVQRVSGEGDEDDQLIVDLELTDAEAQRVASTKDGVAKIEVNDPAGDVGAKGVGPESGLVFEELAQSAQESLIPGRRVFRARIVLDLYAMIRVIDEFNQIKDRRIAQFIKGGHAVSSYKDVPTIDIKSFVAGQRVTFKDLTSLAPLASLGANPTPVDVSRSLMIRDLNVVEDPVLTTNPCASSDPSAPYKAWSFTRLMTEMSRGSGLSPSAFTEQWLSHWLSEQVVRSQDGEILDADSTVFAAGMREQILDPWRKRSGSGELDLNIAPFRLLSIMYRPDLADISPYSGSSERNGGELRFVFGMMQIEDNNQDGDALDDEDTCRSIESSVIFEYKVPLHSCRDIKKWANGFIELSEMEVGSHNYNVALGKLTERVVQHGAAPGRPNQNAIAQVRTNEFTFGPIWQLREFVLPVGGGPLFQTTTKENPREHQDTSTAGGLAPDPLNLNGEGLFFKEVNANLESILAGTYSTPEFSHGQPYLAGSVNYGPRTIWDHPDLNSEKQREARFRVSVNTCSGCHARETSTFFYHVRPTDIGQLAQFSDFLSKPGFVREADGDRLMKRTFDETAARRQALHRLANQVCGFDLGLFPFQIDHVPLRSVH